MAKPRVFISSTHYDFKHIRTSLGDFVGSLGFEPVMSEKGSIAYAYDRPLDESCYREAEGADLFVMLIGRRYGSQSSVSDRVATAAFYERYDSITKGEYEHARLRNVPIYVAIDKGVLSELDVFRLNRDRTDIRYAYAESVNVFHLIESIISQSSISVCPFDKPEEIFTWLREQWSGNYRELLRKQSQLSQIATLAAQVSELKAVSETLKKYMEAVLKGTNAAESETLIAEEEQRLEERRRQQALRANGWTKFMERYGVTFADYCEALRASESASAFIAAIQRMNLGETRFGLVKHLLADSSVQRDINEARGLMSRPPFPDFDLTSGATSKVDRGAQSAKRLSVPARVDGERKSAVARSDASFSTSLTAKS